MFVSSNLSTNEKGHLTIGGVDALSLAKEYGTPLYVMDEDTIRNACRDFVRSMNEYYDGNGMVTYASKAFSCKEIYRIMMEENMGVDVVSGGELYTALSVGFPAEKIHFHGNNKTYEELNLAMKNDVGEIIVDNLEELNTLDEIAGEMGKKANIMFRIKPGVDAHTHDFVQTGKIDSKFGFAIETGEAFEAVEEALKKENIILKGLHCHIGSQILDVDPFVFTAEVMFRLMLKIRDELKFIVSELNLGGGFGIKYLPEDDAKDYDTFMKSVSAKVKELCKENDYPVPFIVIEPGRAIVANSGTTLYTVGSVKNIPNIKTYVSVNGGMTDNPRYALYQSPYTVAIADRADKDGDTLVTVAGRNCESGDIIQENVYLNSPKAGDTLAVFCTGAYNYSMASNYNRVPRPPVVMIKDGKSRVIVKRETYEDIIKNDI
ncbi:MAG: diaminopimelate decarboxylase [Clostridia bacterium]|nr:diaminopimelate decarboxylase [Clostridia bacterium]